MFDRKGDLAVEVVMFRDWGVGNRDLHRTLEIRVLEERNGEMRDF